MVSRNQITMRQCIAFLGARQSSHIGARAFLTMVLTMRPPPAADGRDLLRLCTLPTYSVFAPSHSCSLFSVALRGFLVSRVKFTNPHGAPRVSNEPSLSHRPFFAFSIFLPFALSLPFLFISIFFVLILFFLFHLFSKENLLWQICFLVLIFFFGIYFRCNTLWICRLPAWQDSSRRRNKFTFSFSFPSIPG